MKIHFLTTRLTNDSGGAIYDYNFYNQLKYLFGDSVVLFDDNKIIDYCSGKKRNITAFAAYYSKIASTLLDCDYLFLNSRLYTRFFKTKIKKNNCKARIIMFHHHNNSLSQTTFAARLIHKFFENKFLKQADQIIVPNPYVVDLLKKTRINKQIVYLESSFDKKEHKISTLHNNKMVFVGNVQKRKGLVYGIKAFNIARKKHPDLVLNIVGKYNVNDCYYVKLLKLIDSLDLNKNVVFCGRVSDEDLDNYYTDADLFLFPSLLEGYGWVMVEAMSHGIPVACFNNSAMPYTVKNNYNGVVSRNKDWKDLGKRISALFENENALLTLQKGALETFSTVKSKEQLNEEIHNYLKKTIV